jgi:hypothetical protein
MVSDIPIILLMQTQTISKNCLGEYSRQRYDMQDVRLRKFVISAEYWQPHVISSTCRTVQGHRV